MTKTFNSMLLGFTFAITLASCSKDQAQTPVSYQPEGRDLNALSVSPLKNCHFQDPNPTYTFGTAIAPNTIYCDDGVPNLVNLLTPNPLPNGLQFTMGQLALTGTPSEKVTNAPYDYYLENQSGYVRIKITITVK